MALEAGARFGPYEIVGPAGAGGMGEVYRARDTRLDRTVALKVLPPDLTSDSAARHRFEREARAVAALSHPHICTLHDIGQQDGTDFLVMEYLDGETLAARLARGKLPLDQALQYGIQIADALAVAHKAGIVHRDLKPGNVMLTRAGAILLDFGLAKLTSDEAMQAVSMLATAPGTATAQGTIIGTLQYMAPEQVQGQPADARTDIFALGALLHEMTTGRRTFEASTQASLIARILTSDVPAVSTLGAETPPLFDHVVQRCLAKDQADRWQAAHDVRLQLEWIQAHGFQVTKTREVRSPSGVAWGLWAVTGASLALGATALVLLMLPKPPAAPALAAQFDLILPPEIRVDEYDRGSISPDGRQFVFSATVNGKKRLVRRAVGSAALVTMSESTAYRPFWSPDSQAVAFWDGPGGKLRKVLLSGGPARLLSDDVGGATEAGGTWANGSILFGREGRIYRVAETGGAATALDILPRTTPRRNLAFPSFLPDGRHFVVTDVDESAGYVGSVDASGIQRIVQDASFFTYAAGQLFYSRGQSVFARPFDAERLQFTGAEMRVTERAGSFSASDNGTFVYRLETVPISRLTWFDRGGQRTGSVGEPGPYEQVVLSPRDRHATVVRLNDQFDGDLWDADLATGIFSRLTTDPTHDSDPAWAPDEHALAFMSMRTGRPSVFVKDIVSGKEEPLASLNDEGLTVDQWTPDGRYVILRTYGKAVYAMRPGDDRTPRMLVDTPYTEDGVHVSPDGRWVAFETNESGRWEVYVAAFPAFTSKRQLSSGGGTQPQWRADGRELFYVAPDGSMMSVRVDLRAELTTSVPTRLFTSTIPASPGVPKYGVTRDGQRFLVLEPVGGATSFTFVLNWSNPQSSNRTFLSR